MNIGICCYPTHGGSGVVATELGKHLAQRGHEIAFISYDTPLRLTDLPPRVSYHEVEIEQYPLLRHFPYTLALASKLAEVTRLKKLDLLHAHYAIPFGAAALLARQIVSERPPRIVMTLHGTDITLVGNNASFKPVTRLTIDSADAVTVVSNHLEQETRRQFGTSREISVVYNFIDPARHDVPRSRCLDNTERPDRKCVMHISNFRPVKRITDVIRIFAQVARTVDAELLLIGDGPEIPVAREHAELLGVEDRVRFLGVVDQVSPFLAAADLFLLPSTTESFGLVALEAMASGVPVIASDIGGLPEVVVNGVTGFLDPVGDVEAMSGHARMLLTDPALHHQFSEAARHHAAERFHYLDVVPQYERVYAQALRSKGVRV